MPEEPAEYSPEQIAWAMRFVTFIAETGLYTRPGDEPDLENMDPFEGMEYLDGQTLEAREILGLPLFNEEIDPPDWTLL